MSTAKARALQGALRYEASVLGHSLHGWLSLIARDFQLTLCQWAVLRGEEGETIIQVACETDAVDQVLCVIHLPKLSLFL